MCRAYHFGDGDGERERERDTILFTCDIPSAGVMASGRGSEEAQKRPKVKAMPRKPSHPANPPSWTQNPRQECIVQGCVVEKSLHDYGMVSACVSI